jgi:hypothetical protein
MEINEAVMAFSQSEKIKVGLIWISQALQILGNLEEGEERGGRKIVSVILNMITHEIKLAKTTAPKAEWDEIEPYIDRTLTMIHSGVGHEAGMHLARALSKTTNVGQQSMSLLKSKGIL